MLKDSIRLPAMVPQRMAALGIDPGRVLELAGLPTDLFQPDKVYVNTQQFFALWLALQTIGAPPDLGLRAATEPPADMYDVATMAAIHSANFGEALQKLARYKRLVCPEQISERRENDEVHIEFRWLLAPAHAPSFLTDAAFAATVQLLERGSGLALKPRRIELTRRKSDEAMLRRHFACPVHFNALHDVLVFPVQTLEQPFHTHHPELLDLMVPGLEAALRRREGEIQWLERVKAGVERSMRGQRPSVEQVAKHLCLSPRTLQRKLEDAGTSYQRLLDEVRQDTARRLLTATDLDPGEIAFFLGFEELNSFRRAFQLWEGTTPLRWRLANTTQGVAVAQSDMSLA